MYLPWYEAPVDLTDYDMGETFSTILTSSNDYTSIRCDKNRKNLCHAMRAFMLYYLRVFDFH